MRAASRAGALETVRGSGHVDDGRAAGGDGVLTVFLPPPSARRTSSPNASLSRPALARTVHSSSSRSFDPVTSSTSASPSTRAATPVTLPRCSRSSASATRSIAAMALTLARSSRESARKLSWSSWGGLFRW
jgi:hypothetical protein